MTDFSVHNLPSPPLLSFSSRDEFQQHIQSHYGPFVMQGFARHWPIVAMATSGENGSNAVVEHLKGLASNTPQRLVHLPASTKRRMFYNDDISGVNFKVHQQSLLQSLDAIQQANEDSLCLQCVSVKEHFPHLEDSLQNPLVPDNTHPQIWIGNRVIVAPHFDEACNIAVVACGNRRFTLFPPDQVENLYVGPLDYTPAGQPISLVDIHNPDLDRFPNYPKAYAQALSVELEPGDAIFIPSPWWHHVESLSHFNVLINYWWSQSQWSSSLPMPLMFHAMQVLKNLPEGERQAWKAMMDHYLFADDEQRNGHIPQSARGVLGDLHPQMAQGLHQWLKQQLS